MRPPALARVHPLAARLVDEATLSALERWPPYKGFGLAERLYRSGVLSDAKICEAFVALGATDGTADLVAGLPSPAALGAFSKAVAERHRVIALRVERARLIVAMLDPADTDAIEKVAFFCGLAVEPRAVRPRVLFEALAKAYGIPVVLPDAAFLAAHRAAESAPLAEPPPTLGAEEDQMVAPSPDSPRRVFLSRNIDEPMPAADPYQSPLARSVVIAADALAEHPLSGGWSAIEDSRPRISLDLQPVRDRRPAHSPLPGVVDARALEELRRSLPPGSPLEARDSLPPQVLRLLVPPMRAALLFLVRGAVAVGWDGRAPRAGREQIRDVLLPLTAPSTFERALAESRVVMGDAGEPSTMERILWRHAGLEPPTSFAVMPILVGAATHALLYVDADGKLDDALMDSARRVGNTLADGLAPFVAAGTLFPPVRTDRLKPIA